MALSTERTYYKDTYLTELTAAITAAETDENGPYVVFDRTLFHPQGGGQPSDQGFFQLDDQRLPVLRLTIHENIIKHYYTPQERFVVSVDAVARLVINQEQRVLFARLHSAGHLLANAVNVLYPVLSGCRGNHFPGGQANVGFELEAGAALPVFAEVKAVVEAKMRELISARLPLINQWDATPRTVQFDGFPGYPCGGTHVRHSGEIGTVIIRTIKREKGGLKIGYDLA